MINPGLNVNKAFRQQVEKCMNTIFDEITQHFINANTLVIFFADVALIKGCVIIPNVVSIHFSTCSLKALLIFKPGLIIYPIANSFIRIFVSLSQIKPLTI